MNRTRNESLGHYIWRHPSAILLAVQLLGVLLYPFMEQTLAGRVAFEAFGALVLALAIWSVHDSPTPTWVSVGLAVVASTFSIIDAVHHTPALQLTSLLTHSLFYFYAASSLMAYMLADHLVTRDELFAVGATFTLVAWAFAYVFQILQYFQPGAFTAAANPAAQRTWMELLFLSFTNLSSTGLSDIAPATSLARAVVMLQQLAGVGYVALFVSRLVGLTLARAVGRTAARGDGVSEPATGPGEPR